MVLCIVDDNGNVDMKLHVIGLSYHKRNNEIRYVRLNYKNEIVKDSIKLDTTKYFVVEEYNE